MTFLELVRRAHQEGGIAGSGPTSVDNQTGMALKLVDWVREAWIDIQALWPNWKFLRKKETRTLTVNKREYALVADLNLPTVRKWNKELLFIRDPAGTRYRLTLLEFDEFEKKYASFLPGMPTEFTITPDFTVAFNATPDKAYTVDLNFWMTGERLEEGTDVPSIPEDYHMTIVWLAVIRYASHEGAPQVKTDALQFYSAALRRLEADQLEIPERVQFRKLA
ncbi:MAG: phage adaptor protein [Usitatibacter sp.]